MAQGRILRQLLKVASKSGDKDFREVAEKLIQDERAKKHHLLANDLERILYGVAAPEQESGRRPLSVPVDAEKGLPLLEVRTPVRDLQDIVLSEPVRRILDRVVLEQARSDLLGSWGLHPLGRLLFCGPPGCGKTLAAEVLATELSLEFVVIRFDAVVSSFLGETAANLRRVFDFVDSGRFVVLFDEFDAIGKEREDSSEHGELRRLVNAFLQMLDSYRGRSLLIAATNHERLLDRALWRRFDEVVLFSKPDSAQISNLMATKLRGVRHELDLEDGTFLEKFLGMSHADIERVLIKAIKDVVLSGREFVTAAAVEDARSREEERRNLMADL